MPVNEGDQYDENKYDSESQGSDLDGFIVSEKEESEESEEEYNDRIRDLTSTLKPNETLSQKVLKAHISVLVSALGGPDHASSVSPPPYKLGHDALACLKDIKRWVKSVDERSKCFDVALACFDSGLVVNDLLVILCQWDKSSSKSLFRNEKMIERIKLSCLELLVLLTWPVDFSPDLSEKQKLQFTNVRKSQLVYKKHILAYNGGQTLKSAIRLALPTISKNKMDREPRDNAILRLVLFLLRNIINIEPVNLSVSSKVRKQLLESDNLPQSITYDDISLNAVISCFHNNKVFTFLLTMCNAIGSEFDKETFTQSCLECIYLLVRKVNPLHLLGKAPSKQINNSQDTSMPSNPPNAASMQLGELLKEEDKRKKKQVQNISTRHGKFGSLLSIRDSKSSYVISGQEALLDTSLSLAKLDKTKKWNNRTTFKYDSDEYINSSYEFLNMKVTSYFKDFVEQLLVSGGFNTLLECSSWIFTGAQDLEYIDPYEKACYFITIAWFFSFKRERNQYYQRQGATPPANEDSLDYGSVGVGLSEVNFILIVSYFRTSIAARNWSAVHAAMVCFRELLLISHSIFTAAKPTSVTHERPDELNLYQDNVDRELAEGIIRKLFTFNDFLNNLVQLPQTASKHSQDYLRVCISTVHILLKCFECFANEDIKLYVQTKRKVSKKMKSSLDKTVEDSMRDIIDASDEEYENQRIKEVSKERRLDFQATELRFFHTSVVSSYIDFLSRYEDLTYEEIKMCLSYFHRLFVGRKDFTGLFRLDFIQVLHSLRNFLPRQTSIRKHVEEFIYYFMKKFKSAFIRFPNPIEILFPRLESVEIKSFLGTGDINTAIEKESKKSQPRLAKPLEFIRESFNIDEKIKILVSALYQSEKGNFASWLQTEIERIANELSLYGDSREELISTNVYELQAPPLTFKMIINNSYCRLLLQSLGFELPYSMEEKCELNSLTTTEYLHEVSALLSKWINNQPVVFEDNKDAAFYLRVKEYDIGEYALYDENDESIAFSTEPNTNGSRHNINELDKLDELEAALSRNETTQGSGDLEKGVARRKRRAPKSRKRRPDTPSTSKEVKRSRRPPKSFNILSDDEENEAPVKSAEYVHDSDENSDDERLNAFFEREEKLRRLLASSGGIISHEQLEQFKLAWLKINEVSNPTEISASSKGIDEIVTSMMNNNNSRPTQSEKTSSTSPVTLNDENIRQDTLEANAGMELEEIRNGRYPDGSSETNDLSDSSNHDDSDNQPTSRRERVKQGRNTSLLDSDSDEEQSEDMHINKKKRRVVLSEDEF